MDKVPSWVWFLVALLVVLAVLKLVGVDITAS